MSAEKQTCPRRIFEVGPWEREEDLDAWKTGHGLVGRQGLEKSCSFCGSLHPNTFMEWVRQGGLVTPTDKNYKAYIKFHGVDPREGEVTQYTIPSPSGRDIPVTQVYGTEAKFYFQHLSEAQQEEFVQLYNNKTMVVQGGGFYVLPFFMHVRSD